MGESVFTVINPPALREIADPELEHIAREIMDNAVDGTPVISGTLAAGYRLERIGPSHYRIVNDVPYARYVEYGDSRQEAQPALGRALARARARYGGGL
jgi:hypothetical protein